ncbi:transposable element Tcb1 transposase [Trichonephila clavipes]|nr:transposable element Tcb1 transposase [Trichonephila clavipes]
MKPSNYEADLSSLNARENDGPTGTIRPPRCATDHDDRWIVCLPVMDGTITLRTISQHIQSIRYHSASAGTIRRRLQQSGMSTRRPLLRLPLNGNHRRLRHCWCDERWTWTT